MKNINNKILSLIIAVVMISMLTISAFAADSNFSASVTAKSAPEIVTVGEGEFAGSAALLKDENGTVIEGVSLNDIVVTPISEDSEMSEEDKIILDEAFEEIKEAPSLAELDENFSKIAKEVYPQLSEDKFIVKDLFDVALSDKVIEALKAEGVFIELSFKTEIPESETVFVMTKCPGIGWKTITPDNVTNNGDGTITVRFDEFCPVTFVVADPVALAAASATVPAETEPTQPTEPDNGNNIYLYIGIGAAVLVVAVIVVAVVAKKKKKDE